MSTFTYDTMETSWELDGAGEQRSAEDGGMVIARERWKAGLDTTELFAELPDGACQEQHWGYIISGAMTMRYTDGRTEVLHAGEAYYIAPGHNGRVDEDVDLVEFTPADQSPDRRPE